MGQQSNHINWFTNDKLNEKEMFVTSMTDLQSKFPFQLCCHSSDDNVWSFKN